MKQFFSQPQNHRIIREHAIAAIIIFLLMGFVGPFNVNELDNTRFLYFLLMGLTVFAVGCLAGFFTSYVLKMPLDPSLPLRTVHRNTLVIYLINMPITAACITTIFGAMYCNHISDIWWYEGRINWVPYFHFLYYSVSLGAFICLGTFVRNRNWHLNYELEEMRTINALLEQNSTENASQSDMQENAHPMNADPVGASPKESKTVGVCSADMKPLDSISESDSNLVENMIPEEIPCRFEGSTASSTLEVLPSQIIYVESMANYADVWYLDNDTPTHKMLRITLKQIKQVLDPIPYLVQCHRAFIVNLHFVVTMTNRNNSYQLQIFGTDKQLPVSRTYTPEIKERLQRKCQ